MPKRIPEIKPFGCVFRDPVYRISFVAVSGPSSTVRSRIEGLLKQIGRPGDVKAIMQAFDASDAKFDNCTGRTYRLTPKVGVTTLPVVIMWFRVGAPLGVLVHEADHAVQWIFRWIGALTETTGDTFHNGSDEPRAYYLEWIFQHLVNAGAI